LPNGEADFTPTHNHICVIPAKAGIQFLSKIRLWMPAYAGMTEQAERARHSKRRAFDVLIVVASASTAARASATA